MIDAHVHVWDLPETASPLPGQSATIETLIAEMGAARVERAVLVQPGVYGDDHRYLAAAVARDPERFAAVVLLDPFRGDGVTKLEELVEQLPISGVRFRLNDDRAGAVLAAPGIDNLLDRLTRRGLTLTVLASPAGRESAIDIARRYPELRVVIDHLGSPQPGALDDSGYRAHLLEMQQTPNIWLKLSAFYVFSVGPFPYLDCQPLVQQVIETFGATRLVWGSDFPFARQTATYSACCAQLDLIAPDLAATERAAILTENAKPLWW